MTIEQRVENLERENQWMKRIGTVAAGLVAVVFLMGQGKGKQPPDLVVKSLTVVGNEGRVWARLGIERFATMQAGKVVKVLEPRLALFDQSRQGRAGTVRALLRSTGINFIDLKKTRRVSLGFRMDGLPSLNLNDANGETRAFLLLHEDGSPGLTMGSANGKKRVQLGVGSLLMTDRTETPRVSLGLGSDGSPSLGLSDASWKTRAFLSVGRDGSPGLSLFDANRKSRARLVVGKDRGSFLELSDKISRSRAILGATIAVNKSTGAETKTDENSLTLYNAKGDVIWQAPK